jgi:hypothetical protein
LEESDHVLRFREADGEPRTVLPHSQLEWLESVRFTVSNVLGNDHDTRTQHLLLIITHGLVYTYVHNALINSSLERSARTEIANTKPSPLRSHRGQFPLRVAPPTAALFQSVRTGYI